MDSRGNRRRRRDRAGLDRDRLIGMRGLLTWLAGAVIPCRGDIAAAVSDRRAASLAMGPGTGPGIGPGMSPDIGFDSARACR